MSNFATTQLWKILIRHDPYRSLDARVNSSNLTQHIVVTASGEALSLKEVRAQIGYPRLVDALVIFTVTNNVDPADNSPGRSMYPYIIDVEIIRSQK